MLLWKARVKSRMDAMDSIVLIAHSRQLSITDVLLQTKQYQLHNLVGNVQISYIGTMKLKALGLG